jgi:hypothetical protein
MFWLLAITISAHMRGSPCAIICGYQVDKKGCRRQRRAAFLAPSHRNALALDGNHCRLGRSRRTLPLRRLGVHGRLDRTGLVARIGRADGVAAGPVDLVYAHFETAHAAVLV